MRTPAVPAPTVTLATDPPTGAAPQPPERRDLGVTPLPPRPADHAFPRVRGYEIIGVVGCGGMGVVYEARHRDLNRRVAIKTLKGEADAEFRERFRAEAEAIARLQHPNIIQVFEVGTVEAVPFESHPSPFIALEFVDGGSLAERTRAPQPPRYAAEMVGTLARAAHAAHRLGVIHRDLKPANVLLTGGGEPKIADFGIAKQLGDDPNAPQAGAVTRAGTVMGTPEYMAPEHLNGREATPAVDVYALGVILYELLTARVPFQGATFTDTMLLAMRQDPVPPRRLQPGVPRDLETICLKCLEKDPKKRYPTAEALADDLARWADGRTIRARAVGPAERTLRWAARNPTTAALALVALFVAVIGLAGVLWGWREAHRSAGDARVAADEARDAAQNERWERYRVNVMAASGALRLHDTTAARHALDDAPPLHRDWVWSQLQAQLDRSLAVLRGRGNETRSAAFTPDGRWAVLVGEDQTIRIWDVTGRTEYEPLPPGTKARCPTLSADGAVLAYAAADHAVHLCDPTTGRTRALLRGHEGEVHEISFAPDGARLVTASDDGTLRVWDVAGGQQLRLFRAPGNAARPLLLSPTGRFVVTRGPAPGPAAYLWDLEAARPPVALEGAPGDIRMIRFSPTGDRLVAARQFPQTEIQLWDVETGRRLATLTGHKNQVTHATFSPDGRRLLTTSLDRTIRLWDVSADARSSEARRVLDGHAGWVYHATFSPDGTRILSSSHDRTLRYWDARTGKPIAVLCGHTDPVTAAAFRADGTLVSASVDGTLRLWDAAGAESGYAIRGHTNFVYSVAFFPDGERIASAAWDGTARVWHATTGRALHRFGHGEDQYVAAVAVHPGGKVLATLARHEGVARSTVRLWDVATERVLREWKMPANWQDGRLAFAPRGDLLAGGGADGRVRLWDPGTGSEVGVLEGGTSPVRDVAFSPDGALLAGACDDGDCSVRIWDVRSRQQVRVLTGHRRGVYAVAWNRTGTVLASGSNDHTARMWDTATWAPFDPMFQGTNVYGVAFTADGKLLACACADNLIRVWDANTRRELAELSGHSDYVHFIAFSPDGTRMASSSGDQTLRVWDTLSSNDRAGR